MSIVAPIEFAATVTSGVLYTVSAPMKSEPTVLKSIDRPPVAVARRRPSTRVSLKSPPKPRIVTPFASPRTPSRWIETPGRRCSEAATLESGNLPISSDEMTSTTPDASRFASRLRWSEPRMPVTTISSCSAWVTVDCASGVSFWAVLAGASRPAGSTAVCAFADVASPGKVNVSATKLEAQKSANLAVERVPDTFVCVIMPFMPIPPP